MPREQPDEEGQPSLQVKILWEGEVKRRKQGECRTCGRQICRNEYCWKTVVLTIDGSYRIVEALLDCCHKRNKRH